LVHFLRNLELITGNHRVLVDDFNFYYISCCTCWTYRTYVRDKRS